MNCQDIARIADAGRFEDLDEAQRRAAGTHASTCRNCAAVWGGHGRLAQLPVPPMPEALRQRCKELVMLPPQARRARGTRRLILIGSLVGVAAAAWQIAVRQPAAVTAVAASGATSTVPAPVETVQTAQAAVPGLAADQPEPTQPSNARGVADVALDPRVILVSKRVEKAADAPAIALADRCLDTVASELQALGGLTVVLDPSESNLESRSVLDMPERDKNLARSHGAAHMLVVSTQMGCDFTLFDSRTGSLVQGAGGGGVSPQGDHAYDFAKGMARGIHAHLVGDETADGEFRRRVLDGSLGDRDRATALFRLLEGKPGDRRSPEEFRALLDKEVLAVAVQLAATSKDAGVRSAVWSLLARNDDPAALQPMLRALNDPDNSVRYQGVRMARRFLEVPGVRETLLEMAANDPDSQPVVFCCAQTVREFAERAAVTDADFLGWARRRLLDESLPSRSRLINLIGVSSDGRFVGQIANIGPDAARIVFEIGRRDPDLRIRAMAWDILYFGQADKEFVAREVVPIALEDLRSSPNERARAGAARILSSYKDAAGVQDALESAKTDASIIVRRAALGEGGGPVSAE